MKDLILSGLGFFIVGFGVLYNIHFIMLVIGKMINKELDFNDRELFSTMVIFSIATIISTVCCSIIAYNCASLFREALYAYFGL